MTKKLSQIQIERSRHHAALEQLAKSINPKIQASGLQLWRKLAQLERAARDAATKYCNGEIDLQTMDQTCESVTFAVKRLFAGELPPRFHINRDPRGYALKLDSDDSTGQAATEFPLHQDWGRNQILAPTIN